jgi:hypothetical protein
MSNVVAKERGYYGGEIKEPGASFWFPLAEGETHPAWVEAEETVKERKSRKRTVDASAPAAAGEPAPAATPTQGEEANALTGATQPDWVQPGAGAASGDI